MTCCYSFLIGQSETLWISSGLFGCLRVASDEKAGYRASRLNSRPGSCSQAIWRTVLLPVGRSYSINLWKKVRFTDVWGKKTKWEVIIIQTNEIYCVLFRFQVNIHWFSCIFSYRHNWSRSYNFSSVLCRFHGCAFGSGIERKPRTNFNESRHYRKVKQPRMANKKFKLFKIISSLYCL